MGRMIQMIDHRCAFLSPAEPFGGAYAIRPYPDGRKMIAVGACSAALPEKQAAFRGCHEVGGGKCGAFLCLWVGAYCIRPTNDLPKEGEGPAFGRVQAFAIHGMALCGAYAIRPYPDGQKMITAGACFEVGCEKQAAFWGCYGVGYANRGAAPDSYRLTWHRSCSRRPVLFRSCGD